MYSTNHITKNFNLPFFFFFLEATGGECADNVAVSSNSNNSPVTKKRVFSGYVP